MLRKISSVLLIVLILLSLSPTAIGEQISVPKAPEIAASSAILVDAKSGQILYEKNIHQRSSIASTTKIMTAIITLERAGLGETVIVNKSASEVGESELFLEPGEKMSVQDLLYGLLLQSGNDVAAALADHVGGSVAGFAELMNRKAFSIGARDTHFTNPHGLYDVNHYSTAYDLALIARYSFSDKTFRRIVATKEYTISRQGKDLIGKIKNHNKLLWQYPYANGVKTGYIRQAGHCLVSSANKNGVQLVAVVLNSPSSGACFEDSTKLLEFGFNQFRLEKVIKKGRAYKQVKLPEIFNETVGIVASKDLVVQVSKTPGSLKKVTIAKDSRSLPIAKGERLGEIRVTQFGRNLGKVDLVAARTVAKPGKIKLLILWLRYIFKKIKGN